MFGFSWSEILIIGVVALVLIGPDDLPRAMKTAARWMSAGRKLAREFQGHVDDLVREAELDELRERARQIAMQPLSSHLETFIDPNKEISQAVAQATAVEHEPAPVQSGSSATAESAPPVIAEPHEAEASALAPAQSCDLPADRLHETQPAS